MIALGCHTEILMDNALKIIIAALIVIMSPIILSLVGLGAGFYVWFKAAKLLCGGLSGTNSASSHKSGGRRV